MKETVKRVACGLALLAFAATPALSAPRTQPAASNAPAATAAKPTFEQQLLTFLLGPATTGQPGAECGSPEAPNRPGHAASAPGSAFNPDGKAGTVYAGEQPQNSKNTASVSQYDAACLHVR